MSVIDDKIEKLEKELQALKEQKNKIENKDLSILKCRDDNAKIVVYSHKTNEEEKRFKTFKEAFDYVSKKMGKNDFFAFDYYQDKDWTSMDFENLDETNRQKIMEILSTFDAYSTYTMELGLCNKRSEWKYAIWIETPSLLKYKDAIENRSRYTEDEYWKIMDEMKKWRLF